MAYSQSDLDALQASIAKGVRVAQMGGERVEFRTLAEMERLERKLQTALGLVTTSRVQRIQTESGWR